MTAIAASRHTFGDGVSAGLDTLHRMRAIVLEQIASPVVRQTAAGICHGTGKNSDYQIHLLRTWLQSHVNFLRDPAGHELLHTPELMLMLLSQQGALDVDCDDVAMLAAALGMSIGLRAQFVMIGAEGGYSHIWTELAAPVDGADWQELDITRPFQVDLSQYPMQFTMEV